MIRRTSLSFLLFSLLLSVFQPLVALREQSDQTISKTSDASAFRQFKKLIPAPLFMTKKDLKLLWTIGSKKALGHSVTAQELNTFDCIVSKYNLKTWTIVTTIAVILGTGGALYLKHLKTAGQTDKDSDLLNQLDPKTKQPLQEICSSTRFANPKEYNSAGILPVRKEGNELYVLIPLEKRKERIFIGKDNRGKPQFKEEFKEGLHIIAGSQDSKDQGMAFKTAVRESWEEIGKQIDMQEICKAINQNSSQAVFLSKQDRLGGMQLYVLRAPESFYDLPNHYVKNLAIDAEAEALLWVKWSSLLAAARNNSPISSYDILNGKNVHKSYHLSGYMKKIMKYNPVIQAVQHVVPWHK